MKADISDEGEKNSPNWLLLLRFVVYGGKSVAENVLKFNNTTKIILKKTNFPFNS